jgi:hypothetical protein
MKFQIAFVDQSWKTVEADAYTIEERVAFFLRGD